MKVIAFAFLLAVASATPNRHASDIESAIRAGSERLVTGNIIKAIEDAAQSIRDAGLDPVDLPPARMEYALPVPSVLNANAYHNEVHFSGISNIHVKRMDYAALTSRLRFEIELPIIKLEINGAELDVNILGGNFNTLAGGSIHIKNIVLLGEIRVSIGIITGISIRSMDLNFRLGGIDSYLFLRLMGVNVSDPLNKYLGEIVPNAVKTHQKDIDTLITMIAREIVEANL